MHEEATKICESIVNRRKSDIFALEDRESLLEKLQQPEELNCLA